MFRWKNEKELIHQLIKFINLKNYKRKMKNENLYINFRIKYNEEKIFYNWLKFGMLIIEYKWFNYFIN